MCTTVFQLACPNLKVTDINISIGRRLYILPKTVQFLTLTSKLRFDTFYICLFGFFFFGWQWVVIRTKMLIKFMIVEIRSHLYFCTVVKYALQFT
jgi:hypothetical protein